MRGGAAHHTAAPHAAVGHATGGAGAGAQTIDAQRQRLAAAVKLLHDLGRHLLAKETPFT
jgi:hypothetical protein